MPPSSLVTGATGFIGSQLVRVLLERGEYVKALVQPGANLRALAGLSSRRFQLAVGDSRVGPSVFAALAGCDKLYHVAANFKYWDAQRARIVEPMVSAMRATLRAAEQRGLVKIVVTSSAGVLGVTKTPTPVDETHASDSTDAEAFFAAHILADEVVAEFVDRGQPIVRVLPATVVGPFDWQPTPNGRLLIDYLKTPSTHHFPVAGGGINVVDVEDVAVGHVLAMERGALGERYILGGEDLTFVRIVETLCDLTGLSEPSTPKNKGLMRLLGTVCELNARLRGGEPRLTARLARDYVDAFAYVTSEKAETELGYRHRSARAALARSVSWFLTNGYVPERAARRVRLELRPA